jgi:hypothetical protein
MNINTIYKDIIKNNDNFRLRFESHILPNWRTKNPNNLKEYIYHIDKCWETNYAISYNGYCHFTINRNTIDIQRLAWMLFHKKDIPVGMVIRYKYHNKKCCNPYHLIIGTSYDNVQDNIKDKRHAYGERNNKSKLKTFQIKQILIDVFNKKYKTRNEISKIYNVNPSTIENIFKRKRWIYIIEELDILIKNFNV